MKVRFILDDMREKICSLLMPTKLITSKRYFRARERRGYHVLPVHFHEPVPDTRTLKDDMWLTPSELVGIDMKENSQLELLARFAYQFRREYDSFPRDKTSVPHQYYVNNGAFDSVDGEILYCMIRHFKPKRIFEIGSGNSTYLAAQAVLKNEGEGRRCELVACEPYPNDNLKQGFPGLAKLMSVKVEDIPLTEFTGLDENDILFIDSSHVVAIGSDVKYGFLEIMPRLKKGVVVHIHDIFLPAEYPKKWVLNDYRFWTEQYLLQAFLTFNNNFDVLWAGSFMHLRHPDKLEEAFRSYKRDNVWPGSFWIRRAR